MSFLHVLAVIASVLCFAHAKPIKGTLAARQEPSSNSSDASSPTTCGDIIVAVKNGYDLFYARDVYECLRSVPFNPAVAERFIEYYNDTLQFQSTLDYLKSPPAGYQRPMVDVLQDLETIKQNVTTGVYHDEYEFEAHIQQLISRMHDTHSTLIAGALAAFVFVSPYGLISASVDGKQLPQIYIDDDIHKYGKNASPIVKINGEDVANYITRFAEENSPNYLESHADWNSLMESPGLDIQGLLSKFQSVTLYPGDRINFEYANGTVIDEYWYAFCVDCNYTGPLTTGGDFYNYFVLGELPASINEDPDLVWWPSLPAEADDSEPAAESPPAVCSQGTPSQQNWCAESYGAYPNDPFIAQDGLSLNGGGILSGYMLKDLSTAVLSIPSFVQYADDTDNFRDAIEYFIGNASAAGISRIVIDLQQNGGGQAFLAYDTFKQFFPTIDPYGASRARSHEWGNVLGNSFTNWWNSLSQENKTDFYQFASSEWISSNRLDAETGSLFSTWSQYSGPVNQHGILSTLPQRYNLSDMLFDYAAFAGIPWGYGDETPAEASAPQWAADDIVILTDGLCASACALFVEFMSHQAGVRTIVVGGRPTAGPMQAVSGSRGAAAYSADALDYDFSMLESTGWVNNSTALALLPDRENEDMWIQYAGFTIRNQVRQGDPTPLQFLYQAADCRLYFTLDNVYNVTQLWRDVVRAMWVDASLCVPDSTGYPTARNATAAKTPPAAEKHSVAELDLSSGSPLYLNSTLELVSGPFAMKRVAGSITPCKSGRTCDGNAVCLPLKVSCSDGKVSTIDACQPRCEFFRGGDSCRGISTYCATEEGAQIASKSNIRGSERGTNAVPRSGFCKTNRGTVELGCSRD